MKIETVPLVELKPHPRNYRVHPEEQIAHIARSLAEHGFYRAIVAARDGTILAGHGLYLAARRAGRDDAPTIKLDLDADSPRALKILAGDNEIGKLAEQDDRRLTELLRDVLTEDDLLGTGFDEQSLAALVMVSRPASEIRDKHADVDDHWAAGMPEYDDGEKVPRLIVMFDDVAARDAFAEQTGVGVSRRSKDDLTWSATYPPKPKADKTALEFQ